MNYLIIRGRTLTFKNRPKSLTDKNSYNYDEDGSLLIKNGLIEKIDSFEKIIKETENNIPVHDHRPNLILPGFIDPHLHFPQIQVIGSYASNLLEWLNNYTFIEEQKFNKLDHSRLIAKKFFRELINHGTTTAASFCTSKKESVDAFFEESSNLNMLMIGGKVMMDRNAPKELLDTAKSSYDETKALIKKWHKVGRQYYAISPRFAITSSNEQLEVTKTLLKENASCYLQTHLSENIDEINLTKKLYPEFKSYTEIYENYDLLGPKSLFGHCIHLSEREIGLLSETKSAAVFCPTSNLFLGSGLFNFNNFLKNGSKKIAIATDIGGGTTFSMLKTMDEAYKILQLQNQRINPLESFYQITLGNASALSLENKIGTLDVGTDCDIVVLNSSSTSSMEIRMENVKNLVEELFVLQTMGDDRSIAQVYIKGVASKNI
tara:strand:- start:10115 stop:11416 length:1302 start_codon:yes stop_codon:yes gene_type:complete